MNETILKVPLFLLNHEVGMFLVSRTVACVATGHRLMKSGCTSRSTARYALPPAPATSSN
jgi:hypothetical protein